MVCPWICWNESLKLPAIEELRWDLYQWGWFEVKKIMRHVDLLSWESKICIYIYYISPINIIPLRRPFWVHEFSFCKGEKVGCVHIWGGGTRCTRCNWISSWWAWWKLSTGGKNTACCDVQELHERTEQKISGSLLAWGNKKTKQFVFQVFCFFSFESLVGSTLPLGPWKDLWGSECRWSLRFEMLYKTRCHDHGTMASEEWFKISTKTETPKHTKRYMSTEKTLLA